MILEENVSSSTSLVVHLIIVGFHHKKGHQIEYSYPSLSEPLDERWSNIGSLALPDGVHNRDEDLIYFHLPSIDNDETLFGVASYRQIDAKSVTNKEADVTRNSIQKSVCLLLRQPIYGNVCDELHLLTQIYFNEKDFSQRKLFEEFVDRLNLNPPKFDLKYFCARDLVLQYRRKTLILFKLLLLQKKVLFMLSPIEHLVKTILTLVSLIPDLIEKGLNQSTFIHENIDWQNDEDVHSLRNSNDVEEINEQMKTTLLKRATSITNKLTDSFNRLTTTSNNFNENSSQDLTHLDQFGFPIELFSKNNNLYPYLSIHSLDLINNCKLNSYLIGASNGLFRQQNQFDFILTDQDEDFLIQSSILKNQLQLTTADLRFTQLFQDQSGVKSEEEIRRLFLNYLLSLLSVATNPNDEGLNDFNSSFVKEFQSTRAFRLWQSKGPYPYFEQIIPRHPQAGQLNVADVKLRVAHVLDDSETGRKLKGAIEDTSQFMGEKSRAATKVLGQAKNSIFSSVIGSFNQGKQWLSRSQSSNE